MLTSTAPWNHKLRYLHNYSFWNKSRTGQQQDSDVMLELSEDSSVWDYSSKDHNWFSSWDVRTNLSWETLYKIIEQWVLKGLSSWTIKNCHRMKEAKGYGSQITYLHVSQHLGDRGRGIRSLKPTSTTKGVWRQPVCTHCGHLQWCPCLHFLSVGTWGVYCTWLHFSLDSPLPRAP